MSYGIVEEVLYSLTTIRHVSGIPVFQPSGHVCIVVLALVLKLFGSCGQQCIISFNTDGVLWNYFLIQFLFKLLFNFVCSFRILVLWNFWWDRNFIHENFFSILLASWVAIQYETFVLASGTVELKSNKITYNVIRQSWVASGSIEIRILLLSGLLILSFSSIFKLLNSSRQLLAVLVGQRLSHCNDIFDGNVRDTVLLT